MQDNIAQMPAAPADDLGIIIAASGSGQRYGPTNKLFEILAGKPLFIHSILNLCGCCSPSNLVVVAPASGLEQFNRLLNHYLPGNEFVLVAGGRSRGESVWCGLQALAGRVEYVAVHDAARPLASAALLLKCLDIAVRHGGAVPAKPVTDTLKQADYAGRIVTTVERARLWRVETPQVFSLSLLCSAYRLARERGMELTDDAGIMENAGFPVQIVPNPDNNLKVTYSADLTLLKFFLTAPETLT